MRCDNGESQSDNKKLNESADGRVATVVDEPEAGRSKSASGQTKYELEGEYAHLPS